MEFNAVEWVMGVVAVLFVGGAAAWANHIRTTLDKLVDLVGGLREEMAEFRAFRHESLRRFEQLEERTSP